MTAQSLDDIPEGSTVWVTFTNSGYMDMMLNWVRRCLHQLMQPVRHVIASAWLGRTFAAQIVRSVRLVDDPGDSYSAVCQLWVDGGERA